MTRNPLLPLCSAAYGARAADSERVTVPSVTRVVNIVQFARKIRISYRKIRHVIPNHSI